MTIIAVSSITLPLQNAATEAESSATSVLSPPAGSPVDSPAPSDEAGYQEEAPPPSSSEMRSTQVCDEVGLVRGKDSVASAQTVVLGTSMDSVASSLSYPRVFKAAEKASPLDRLRKIKPSAPAVLKTTKGNIQLDFRSIDIEDNNDASSDHSGQAAKRQMVKERVRLRDESPSSNPSPPPSPSNESTLADAVTRKEVKANKLYGAATVFFGVCFSSPDAMILRLIEKKSEAPSDMIVFWKSLIKSFLLVLLIASFTGFGKSFEGARRGPRYVLLGALFGAGVTMGYTFMLLATTAARAMLFVSLNPLWSALLGRIFLNERLERRTLVALAFATLAVLFTFAPQDGQEDKQSSLLGDLVAVLAGVSISGLVVTIRAAALYDPKIEMLPAAVLGSVVSLVAGAVMMLASGSALLPAASDGDGNGVVVSFFLLVTVDTICIFVFIVTLNIGPRFLTGPEVSLITLTETVLGPLWVFLWFGESPGVWTFVGGAVLLATLASHEVAGMYSVDGGGGHDTGVGVDPGGEGRGGEDETKFDYDDDQELKESDKEIRHPKPVFLSVQDGDSGPFRTVGKNGTRF